MSLPQGWAEARFADIARQRSGNGKLIKGKLEASAGDGLFPAFSASGQDVWRDGYDDEGDAIVVSAVGARCGKAFRGTGKWSAIANTHVVRAEPEVVDTDFLYLILNDESFWEKGGTAQPFVKVGATFERVVAFPPLAEQRRIVAKLDALTARLARARAELERVPVLADSSRRASLDRATSPAGDGAKSLLRAHITKVRTGPFGSAVHKSDYIQGGTPLINPMHIVNGRIIQSAKVSVHENKARQLQDFRLLSGDVIIGRRGEMGRCAVVTTDEEGFLIGTGSMALRPGPELHCEYLQIFLSSPKVVAALERAAVGSTMVNLNQKILLDLQIFVPSREQQAQRVIMVQHAFARADRLEAEAARALALLDRLEAAILAKAFRGELVPQDPDDEPASVLLERVRAQRAAAPKPKRGRKTKGNADA